jgi:queuine tRNA-ribosyltransferase catalytic subunit
MGQVRQAIKQDRYPEFVRSFFNTLYHGEKLKYPKWAIDALNSVGINLLEEQTLLHQEIGSSVGY